MNENNKMNAMLDKSTDEFIDFDKLEAQLEDELEDQMSDLQFLGTIFKSGRCYCRRRFY